MRRISLIIKKIKLFVKLKKKHNLLPKEDSTNYQNLNKNKGESNYQTFREELTEQEQQGEEKDDYTCAECFKDKTGSYWICKEKSDGNKLCSKRCFQEHYGEICNKCAKSCLEFHRDNDYSNIVYCLECWKEKQMEEKEQERSPVIYCRYCSTKTDIFDVCDKKECLAEMNKEIENKKDKDNNTDSPTRERERERDILSYFITNNIQSITLTNNKLLIKYNHKEEEEEEEEPKTVELRQIKDYLQQQPTKTVTLNDLEQKSNSSLVDNKNDRTSLYVGCGVIGVVLIGLVLILVIKSKKSRKY